MRDHDLQSRSNSGYSRAHEGFAIDSLRPLSRILGPTTTFLIGLGVAIGSGIFRTPGIVAAALGSPWAMLAVWLAGGLFIVASSLVSAELATRFPKAGGEYAYLKEAYGELIAFFFGYGYTVFIVGGGVATIAAASGEAAADLFELSADRGPALGVAFIVLITAMNAIGLKVGAGVQNTLTIAKIVALIAVGIFAFMRGSAETTFAAPLIVQGTYTRAFVAAFLPVLWAYEGTTDSIKMAEEMKDPERNLPRALLASATAITLLYLFVNAAFLSVMTPSQMATSQFVASDIMASLFGATGRKLMALLSLVVFLAALSATMLATVRVTFALARDGLTFRGLATMSPTQAPVKALVVVAAIAITFTISRDFSEILNIYFLAAAILFGLTYASLIVFRVRDRRAGGDVPAGVFRCPAGPVLASLLVLFEIFLAVRIIQDSPADSLSTLGLLASFAVIYWAWKRPKS